MQSNIDLLNLLFRIPQLSDEPSSISLRVMLPFPNESRLTVTDLVLTDGLILSWIVTTTLAESLLPSESVTTRKTVSTPMSEHIKTGLVSDLFTMLQLSVEPLSASTGLAKPIPVESIFTIIGWVKTFGLIVSLMSITTLTESVFPFTSVTAK